MRARISEVLFLHEVSKKGLFTDFEQSATAVDFYCFVTISGNHIVFLRIARVLLLSLFAVLFVLLSCASKLYPVCRRYIGSFQYFRS